MEAAGLLSLVPLRSLAVMGFVELIPSLYTIYRALRLAVSSAYMDPLPDAIITIDYKGFNFRLLVGQPQIDYLRSCLLLFLLPSSN